MPCFLMRKSSILQVVNSPQPSTHLKRRMYVIRVWCSQSVVLVEYEGADADTFEMGKVNVGDIFCFVCFLLFILR